MKTFSSRILGLILLVAILHAKGEAATITSITDLQNNSTVDGSQYVLNPGGHTVPFNIAATIDISGTGTPSLGMIQPTTTLTLDATGRTTGSSLLTVREFVISTGGLTAIASGMGGNNPSLWVNDGFTHKGNAHVAVTGNHQSTGIRAAHYFQYDNATLEASGGSGSYGSGMEIVSNLTQFGNSSVVATGGSSGTSQKGLHIEGGFFQFDSASLVTSGGSGGTWHTGVFVRSDFAQHDNARVSTSASGGTGSRGLHVAGNFDQNNNAVFEATGGNGEDQYGAVVEGYFNQNNDSIATATAGSGRDAYGLRTNMGLVQNGNAIFTAIAGNGENSYGLSADGRIVQNDTASIVAIAGSGNKDNQVGILIYGDIIQMGNASISATGGDGAGDYQAGVIAQGAVVQYGNASITATGGSGTGGGSDNPMTPVGIVVYNESVFNGTVRLLRQGTAASIYASNQNLGNTVSFEAGSRLVPVVDLLKQDDLASGLLQAQAFTPGDVAIDIKPGALLSPEVHNELLLRVGGTHTILFMDASSDVSGMNGTIGGEFTLEYEQTETLRFSAEKNGANDKYFLVIERLSTPQTAQDNLLANEYRNSNSLLDAIQNNLGNATGPAAEAIAEIYAAFDNAVGEDAYRELAKRTGRLAAPQQATRMPLLARHRQEAVLLDFRRNLSLTSAMAKNREEYAAASDSAVASIACLDMPWRLWANPVYQQTSHRNGKTAEFDSNKEWFAGAAVGAAADYGIATLGVNAHYLRGDVDAAGYDSETDSFGISLGARFHDFIPSGGWFNPYVETIVGYTREHIEQKRMDYSSNRQHAKPKVNLYSAGVTFGNTFDMTNCLALTPLLGADYIHVDQKSYSENGGGYLGLTAKGHGYDSLRLKAGVEAIFRINAKVELNANAIYRYEALDRETRVTAGFRHVPAVRFATYGERLDRSSGNLGAGIGYNVNERTRLAANYDLWVADKFLAHQGSLSIAVDF